MVACILERQIAIKQTVVCYYFVNQLINWKTKKQCDVKTTVIASSSWNKSIHNETV